MTSYFSAVPQSVGSRSYHVVPAGLEQWAYLLTADKVSDRYTLNDLLRDPGIQVRGRKENTLMTP